VVTIANGELVNLLESVYLGQKGPVVLAEFKPAIINAIGALVKRMILYVEVSVAFANQKIMGAHTTVIQMT
jgi:hypothetical protein